jgi:hypothetical protein
MSVLSYSILVVIINHVARDLGRVAVLQSFQRFSHLCIGSSAVAAVIAEACWTNWYSVDTHQKAKDKHSRYSLCSTRPKFDFA